MAPIYFRKQRVDYFDRPHRKVLLARGRYDLLTLESRVSLLAAQDQKTPGYLRRRTGEAYTEETIAAILNEEVELVYEVLNFCIEWGEIEKRDDGYFIPEVADMTTSETEAAARKRKERERKRNTSAAGQSHDNVATLSRDTEIETETDKDSRTQTEENSSETALVIERLNEQAGTQYKPTTKQTRVLISARVHDGATPEDFYAVIDYKAAEWGADPKMRGYLRPSTLFAASHFAEYREAARVAGNGSSPMQHSRICKKCGAVATHNSATCMEPGCDGEIVDQECDS